MKPDSPLRAEADSRFTDKDANIQAGLFDQDFTAASTSSSVLNDYRQRYGLSEDPFTDDPGFPLFTGGGRRQLLDQLLHLCQFGQQMLVITGESGVGKTRIAHALADSLEEQDELCFLALSPGQSLEQILVAIAESFNLEIPTAVSAESLLTLIEQHIADNFSAESDEQSDEQNDGLILLIIDNAEHLDSQSIAVLASLIENKPQPYALHLVLVGEPLLVSRLNGLESESLQITDFHLSALSLDETVDYLNFRMEMADYLGPEIFTDAVVDPWWRQSRGQLNLIHEMAQDKLLESVTPEVLQSKSHLPVFHIIAISAVIAIAAVLYIYLDDPEPAPGLQVAVPVQQSSASVQAASATSAIALTTTETSAQPLLPSLPQAQSVSSATTNTTQTAVSEPALSTASIAATTPVVETPQPVIETPQPIVEKPVEKPVEVVAKSSVNSTIAEAKPSGRYSADEEKILNWSANQFTIQLLGVSSLKAAKEFVSSQSNARDLLIFKTRRAGKDWFVVITGHYPSNAQARSAINQLPAVQREAGPWPRQIKVIQDEIRQ
jgi:DamX protein